MGACVDMVCVSCPIGCNLTVAQEGGDVVVTGAQCRRGVSYGKSEFTNPVRMVTTLVRVKGGERPVVSVRTSKPVPKKDIAMVLELCRHVVVSAPVEIGDVLVQGVSGEIDADIVATADNKLKHK